MNFLRKVLTESRESDFKAKYQTKFADQDLENIIKMVKTIPNGTKFLDFVGRTIPTAFTEEQLDKVQELLRKFVSIAPNLPMTDINQYDSLEELNGELKKHENKIRRQVQAIEGANIVYEDNKYTVVNPLTYKSSCYYGAGTKWCTSSEKTQQHWNDKNAEGKLFYIFDKTLPTSNKFYKVALHQLYDGNQTFWDAPDNYFTTGWIFGTPEFQKIMLSIDAYMQDNFADKIKLYSDKAALEKEKKRLEAERQADIIRQKLVDAQERREGGEWDEDEIGDEESEAALANAFLVYLKENSDVDVLSDEDKLRINDLKRELYEVETLANNPNTPEETLDDLEEKKENIESALEDYEDYIDVYNIVPEGNYLRMKLFSVVGTPQVDPNEKWAIGTYDQAEQSAVEYVNDLINDMGVDAFNPNFVSNYIDYDYWEGYLKEFFEEDVYNNPDVYLDESQRELSHEQEKKISELEMEERILEDERSNLEAQKDELDTDNEDWEEQYDAFNNKISEIEDRMSEILDEIEEIKENPEGDYDEDALEEALDDRVREYANDPSDFYSNFFGDGDYSGFLKRNRLINMDELTQGVVDTDGIGATINTYDGTESEVSFRNTTYVVIQYE